VKVDGHPEDGDDVSPKRLLTYNGLHGVISQNTVPFIMPLWHNEERFETSELQGAPTVGKQTQLAQRVTRLCCKR
jgi:hypothetical protein